MKVKGTITWVGVHDAVAATVNLYDRLFSRPQPDAGGRDFRKALNPANKRVVQAWLEPSLATVARRPVCNSNATVTSSPTAWTTIRSVRCSNPHHPRSGTPGRSDTSPFLPGRCP